MTTIKRSAEAKAAPNRFADTNPTTRVLKAQVRETLLHLTAGQLIWSNTSLAGVKLTTVMSAWITMSPLYRVQQDMPHEEE